MHFRVTSLLPLLYVKIPYLRRLLSSKLVFLRRESLSFFFHLLEPRFLLAGFGE